MSEVRATEGLVDPCAILEQRLFLKHDAGIVCRLCANVALATGFCAAGRTFDDIAHREQARTGCCLPIGTFSSTPSLAQGSRHNSFVYSVASRWALKCGRALEHERRKTRRTSQAEAEFNVTDKTSFITHVVLDYEYKCALLFSVLRGPSNIRLGS